MQPFLINNRYLVDTTLNTIVNNVTEEETRVEQRFVAVLCLLAQNAGQLVHRERLIKEIWNDYGGADEGLTQAVSYLRKFLDDSEKTVIQTVPKKGYILNAAVTVPTVETKPPTPAPRPRKRRIAFLAAAAGLLLALGVGLETSSFRSTERFSSPDLLKSVQGSPAKQPVQTTNHSPDVRPDLYTPPDTAR